MGLAAAPATGGTSLSVAAAGGLTAVIGGVLLVNGVKNLNKSQPQQQPSSSNQTEQKAENQQKKFGGKQDTQSKTSKEGFRNAKDQNAVPRSQQPTKQYKTTDKNTGKPLRTYDFKNSKGETVTIRKDNPVKYKDGGKQGEHYNAGKTGEKLKQHHTYGKKSNSGS